MIAVDTSVAVPLVAAWHEAHGRSAAAATGAAIPAHAFAETYAVLTRLPPPHRVAPAMAVSLLAPRFPSARILIPNKRVHTNLLGRLCDAGVSGGATYDALIGITAAAHDVVLLTRDARAATTYDRLGIPFELLD